MEGAERDADDRSDEQGQDRGHALVDGELGDDEMGEQHRGADGEIDAGGQDDQRLTDRQRGQHGGLLEDDPDRVSGRWKRPSPKIVNTMHDTSRTKVGLITG